MTECNKAKYFQYSAPTVATSTFLFQKRLILGVVHKYLEARPENSRIFLPPSAVAIQLLTKSKQSKQCQTNPTYAFLCSITKY